VTEDEPRWLTADEQAAWLGLANVLVALPRELDAQLRRTAKMSHFEYLVLAMLSEAPDRARTMSELSAITGGTLSRLSHVVSRLEQRGWVRRAANSEDARSTKVTLTPPGYTKLAAVAPLHVSHVRALVIDALTNTQLEQLQGITERILSSLT
jgi:DNA-binding MarR family transcriptional regulator